MTLPVISAAGDDISDVAVVQEGRKCFIFQRGLTDTLSVALLLHCIRPFEATAKHWI